MLLTIYRSKRDIYGNTYYAVVLSHLGRVITTGKIDSDNISIPDCRDNLKWEVVEIEMPIRKFNSVFKGTPHLGCRWEEIRDNLMMRLLENEA